MLLSAKACKANSRVSTVSRLSGMRYSALLSRGHVTQNADQDNIQKFAHYNEQLDLVEKRVASRVFRIELLEETASESDGEPE